MPAGFLSKKGSKMHSLLSRIRRKRGNAGELLEQSAQFFVCFLDRLSGQGGRYFGCQAEELSRYFRGRKLILRSICFYAF